MIYPLKKGDKCWITVGFMLYIILDGLYNYPTPYTDGHHLETDGKIGPEALLFSEAQTVEFALRVARTTLAAPVQVDTAHIFFLARAI